MIYFGVRESKYMHLVCKKKKKKTQQFKAFEKSIIYFKVQHKVVFLRNTHSILYLKTWLCAFQFIFKINSGIQMLHTSSTNSTENVYGLNRMFLHSFTVLKVDLHFCNLLLNRDSLILKKYSIFQHKVLIRF